MAAGLQIFMRRNSVYVAFILGGALLGERVSLPSDLQRFMPADRCLRLRRACTVMHIADSGD